MSKRLLEECLKYTFENVPYYRDTIDKNICLKPLELFKNIPVLNKETVLSNKHLFLSDFYKADYYAGNLIQKHTSGSTGICLEVFWSMLDDAMSNLSAWKYRRKWYDVDPKSKFLSFHSSIYKANHFIEDPEMILYDKDINISVNKLYLTDKNIEYIADKINAFAPVWILVQPSVLYSLIHLLKKKENACFFDRIQYIELTGEYLQSGLLSYFKSYFPKAKIANMYGAIEFGTIALECPHGHMHIISNNVYVELTEQNTVLLTSLKNTVMPLLRYEIGDRAVLKKTSCSCGGDDLTIELKAGRIGQNIIPAGRQ